MADVALHPFPLADPEPASSGLIAPDPSPSGRRFIHTLLNDAGRADDVLAAEAVYARTPDIAPPTLLLDDAVAAILMGDAFEEMCDAYRGLREDDAVIIIVVPDATIMHAFELVVTRCLLDATLHPARFGSRETSMVLICDSMAIDKPQLEREAIEALAAGVSVCALAVDPARNVPAPLRAMVDHTIRMPQWNPARLSLLLEAVTGETVAVPDDPWITSVILDDLRTSVSSRRGAAGSLARLEKTVARRTATTDAAPDLRDLSGYGVAKDIALGLIDDLQAFGRGELPWSAVERGILLEGPPGTGKSLFASAFARTAGLPIVRGSLAIWQAAGTGHLGDLLQAMQTTFAEARALAPAVLFIDEIDSFGDRASFAGRHRDYGTQVLNAFLEQLDGGADRTGVVVLGATNRREAIDPAILRPGRFDRLIAIQLPDADALAGILRTCLGADLPDADLGPLALAARGASGAQVAAWVRRARGAARRADRPLLVEDVARAIAEDRAPLPPDIRRRVAVHEAGHAVATLALGLGTLDELVLTERGGFATSVPTPAVLTRSRGLAEIVRLLAGRAAEIVLYGAPSAGAGGGPHSDIGCATRIALGIEGSWGLGEAGPIHLGDVDDPSTASLVLHTLAPAVRRLLRHAEAEAERLVRANRDAILRCADRLVPVGRLNGEEATMAIGAVASFALASDSPAADGVVRPGVRA